MSRRFRGMEAGEDDWWSEDWVGSVTEAGNRDPDGEVQGPSVVPIPGVGEVPLRSLIEALPEEMLGREFVARWGLTTGVLVKLLSPSGPVPLHAHPTRSWAQEHLGSRFGKTEAWILLETPGDGTEPAYAGIGFQPGVTSGEFRRAVDRQDVPTIRSFLHRTEVHPGEIYVASAGVPHFLGPRISFIEVQEPTDLIVIPEWSTSGVDADGATMGLGWDVALGMIDYAAADRETTLARARQTPSMLRDDGGNREVRLMDEAQAPFFDATRLEVADRLTVDDGRFSVDIVTAGDGVIEGDFPEVPVRRGQTFAIAASVPHAFRAGRDRLEVVRCMGPRP